MITVGEYKKFLHASNSMDKFNFGDLVMGEDFKSRIKSILSLVHCEDFVLLLFTKNGCEVFYDVPQKAKGKYFAKRKFGVWFVYRSSNL